MVGPCCCFVPLGSEEVPTHWGNSHLTFSLYQRVARWVLDADSTERVSDRATLAALERGEAVTYDGIVNNLNRSVGAMLSNEVSKRYGGAGLGLAFARKVARAIVEARRDRPSRTEEVWRM